MAKIIQAKIIKKTIGECNPILPDEIRLSAKQIEYYRQLGRKDILSRLANEYDKKGDKLIKELLKQYKGDFII